MHKQPLLGPTLETERLILRPPVIEDFEALFAVMQDEEAMQHLGGVKKRADAWKMHMIMIGCWAANGFAMFSVIEKASGQWIGRIGPWFPEGWPGTEIGYTLAKPFWGKGYAYEAAVASVDWAIDHLGWHEIIHTIGDNNTSSIKLAHRLGSRKLRRAILPVLAGDIESDVWGQSADEWRARRAA
ncbi:MAG: GNAT family N-acetyltransferase [Pseudomonadota bacterium]